MRAFGAGAALLAVPLLAACDKQGAWGEANSIIVGASPDFWDEVVDTVHTMLEPRIRTVGDERMFQVTYHDPGSEHWPNMRRFRQLLLLGTGEEAWMQPVMNEAGRMPEPPAVVQVPNVWARNQLVTVVLLPRPDAEAVQALLPEVRDLYGRQYLEWARGRMFLSGRDSAGVHTLRGEAGFSLLLPQVYQWRQADSVYVFRNDNPDPSEFIRQISVSWRSPGPATLDDETLLAWRSEVAAEHYGYPQHVDLSLGESGPFDYRGRPSYQLQALWQNPPDSGWPAGGPFIVRAIPCPEQDRVYLIDAWLYAPGRPKYEFMIQLQTILDSFECGGA